MIQNRSELLFLYDIRDGNPNGDPMDENKPRIDEETGINIVTDVRLKRTVRDYFKDYKALDIFICQEIKEDGTQRTREERIDDLDIKTKEDEKKLLEQYIDLRLFGALIALKGKEKGKGKSIKWIGPVQFKFGRSLHQVEAVTIKGTSVMPSKAQVTTGTFIETQILPYSLICFSGIVNENSAKDTGLREEDVTLLLDGIWFGTKNLITRSKYGQLPRFLLRTVYKDNHYHIGDLDKRINLVNEKGDSLTIEEQLKLRSSNDYLLDVTELITTLRNNKEQVLKFQIKNNENFEYSFEGKKLGISELLTLLKDIAETEEI